MRSKNEVLCAAAGRLAAERSEADKPAKAHKTIFAPNNIWLKITKVANLLRQQINYKNYHFIAQVNISKY
jgi:hypothetical protein